MEVNITGKLIESDPLASDLIDFLRRNADKLALEESQVYYDFPVLKDLDGDVVRAKILILSPKHGVVAIGVSEATGRDHPDSVKDLENINNHLDHVYSLWVMSHFSHQIYIYPEAAIK